MDIITFVHELLLLTSHCYENSLPAHYPLFTLFGEEGIIYFKFYLVIQVKSLPLISRDVFWGALPFVSFKWFAVAGPQAGGAAAAAASLLDQVMGVVLQTSKSEPH